MKAMWARPNTLTRRFLFLLAHAPIRLFCQQKAAVGSSRPPMTIRQVYRSRGLFKMRNLSAAGIAIALAPMLNATARAATITVDSLADTGAPGICVLRDAITAANTMTATNGCVAGTGHDTIDFSVTGTIFLGSTLPEVTDSLLAIIGPASPGIIIDGAARCR